MSDIPHIPRQSVLTRSWQHPALRCARQLGGVTGFWLLGLAASTLMGWPQLAGVTGMATLWLALRAGLVRLDQVRLGAAWLLTHMLLFFIPAVLVVLDHRELLGWVGLKLFAAIVVGTLLVMASTALTIEWCLRWSRRRHVAARRRHAGAHRGA
ncbi:CidA/LrgA family protein [Comamonadaceae bacterium PP-2]